MYDCLLCSKRWYNFQVCVVTWKPMSKTFMWHCLLCFRRWLQCLNILDLEWPFKFMNDFCMILFNCTAVRYSLSGMKGNLKYDWNWPLIHEFPGGQERQVLQADPVDKEKRLSVLELNNNNYPLSRFIASSLKKISETTTTLQLFLQGNNRK